MNSTVCTTSDFASLDINTLQYNGAICFLLNLHSLALCYNIIDYNCHISLVYKISYAKTNLRNMLVMAESTMLLVNFTLLQ